MCTSCRILRVLGCEPRIGRFLCCTHSVSFTRWTAYSQVELPVHRMSAVSSGRASLKWPFQFSHAARKMAEPLLVMTTRGNLELPMCEPRSGHFRVLSRDIHGRSLGGCPASRVIHESAVSNSCTSLK